jgi:hypothetical protein
VPKIADFGLAKLLYGDGGQGLTQTGELVGTPSYMSPEQATAGSQIGPATDVYALGAILYELLTGRAPFRADSALATLLQVLHVDPVSVTSLQPAAPRDLATIAMKCLEKEPSKRYSSALALADDLRSFLDGRAIRARRIGALGHAWRWCRRKPWTAALLASLVMTFLVGFALVAWQWREADMAHHQADVERSQAQRLSAGLALDQGIKLCETGEVAPGLLWMARALELTPADQTDLAFAARANLAGWRSHLATHRRGDPQGTAVTAVAYSPDGRWILTGNWGNKDGEKGPALAILWDAAAWQHGEQVRKLTVQHDQAIWSVAFSPDGRTFATASQDGTARIWDTLTGQPVGEPMRYSGAVFAVAFSPDGRTLATAGFNIVPLLNTVRGGEVRLWDAATGKAKDGPTLLHNGLIVRSLAWSPDGQSLATGGYLPGSTQLMGGSMPITAMQVAAVAGMATVWDVATRKPRGPNLLHADEVRAVAFDPHGSILATACRDGVARLWDVPTLRRLPQQFVHPHPIQSLAFCRDGQLLVTGSGDFIGTRTGIGEVRVWDVASAQQVLPARGVCSEWSGGSQSRRLRSREAVVGSRRPADGPAVDWW